MYGRGGKLLAFSSIYFPPARSLETFFSPKKDLSEVKKA